MFERYTDRARRAVVLAQDAARELGFPYVGVELLLLGLVRIDGGVAKDVLTELGITEQEVAHRIPSPDPPSAPESGHIPYTPRARAVLELALREALKLGQNYVGTEHVLLGLVAEAALQRTEVEDSLATVILLDILGPGGPGLVRVKVLNKIMGGTSKVEVVTTTAPWLREPRVLEGLHIDTVEADTEPNVFDTKARQGREADGEITLYGPVVVKLSREDAERLFVELGHQLGKDVDLADLKAQVIRTQALIESLQERLAEG